MNPPRTLCRLGATQMLLSQIYNIYAFLKKEEFRNLIIALL